ncbi:glycoside hydrolase superfamily [Roridomyces roridus]|uniref:mannan endo-1,4-beta-mannosidase n=1 Tax=Roridomyces roridus TaxID=1738132 RepID=A0AAD7BPC3_9AGAR|nr:glycoside hydrolase superfamily [Roridomyces roridus]
MVFPMSSWGCHDDGDIQWHHNHHPHNYHHHHQRLERENATGFVKTSGTKFALNGAPYTVVGSNSYWLSLFGFGAADVNTALNDIVNSGATTVRTMGFNEVTTPTGIYFHLWNGTTATVNTGADGLGYLDTVIAAAKAHGLRLIVVLTNNWSDFGGMDVYTQQILGPGQFHDVFFTNPTLIAAYKSYVQAVVTRYLNEPTIMAWELSNEPRCQGTNTHAQPSPTCNNTNHLVAIGDEGFLNVPGDFDYPYSGTIGIDFVANLAIASVTISRAVAHYFTIGQGQCLAPVVTCDQRIPFGVKAGNDCLCSFNTLT